MMQPNMKFWDFSVKNVYSVFKKIVNLAQLSDCSSCGCLLCSPDWVLLYCVQFVCPNYCHLKVESAIKANSCCQNQ
jgi:hypothetical protein